MLLRTDNGSGRGAMRMAALLICAAALFSMGLFAQGQQPIEETGFQKIFNGSSLKGWDCDPDFWRVEQGSMVAETRPGPSRIFSASGGMASQPIST